MNQKLELALNAAMGQAQIAYTRAMAAMNAAGPLDQKRQAG